VPEAIALTIVYEDDDLLVVDKPAGMVVHPGAGNETGTLVHALLARPGPLALTGAPKRPGIVHRLDKGTSGLLIVARNDAAHRALVEQFRERSVDKFYEAIVWGRPRVAGGTIETRIGRDPVHRLKMSARSPNGRPAVTHWRVLATVPGFAHLELKIETGRTHQIRVHLQSLGHPVVGDERYGGASWRGVADPARRQAIRRLDHPALHARRLSFDHPRTGRRLSFESPLPDDLVRLFAELGTS
jgi:23S rRNA pseudouridine1911/1915/1917 synthase